MAVKKTDPEDMAPVPAEQAEAREPKEKRTTTKKSDGKAAGFCVYLGPSIRGVIQSGTVYRLSLIHIYGEGQPLQPDYDSQVLGLLLGRLQRRRTA